MERISGLLRNRRLVAVGVLAVVLLTLGLDIAQLVAPCPYCRTQRAALGILALILLVAPRPGLLGRYVGALAGVFGLVVGVTQNFNHIKKMNRGEFDWAALTIGHPWVLSGLAVITLVWLLMLLFEADRPDRRG
jgi:disulfide bond formation protein DsbB